MTAQVLASTLVLLLVTGRALAIARLRAVDRAVEGVTALAAKAVADVMTRVALRAAMAATLLALPNVVEPAEDGVVENAATFAAAVSKDGFEWN